MVHSTDNDKITEQGNNSDSTDPESKWSCRPCWCEVVGEIEQGLAGSIGAVRRDDEAKAKRLMEWVTTYRVFGDEDDKNEPQCEAGRR